MQKKDIYILSLATVRHAKQALTTHDNSSLQMMDREKREKEKKKNLKLFYTL